VEALLERRLDRLRSVSRPAGGLSAPAPQVDHAAPLAEALGGRLVGGVAVVESSFAVPIDLDRLKRLPYPIDTSATFVCLDLETTGLATAAGTLAFLVGVGIWRDGQLVVHQLVLHDHASEVALLDVLCSIVPANGWLVTYNGKSFDWPLLTARVRLHRRPPPPALGHLDLLPVARQLWKHRLGGARLAIVEAGLCGVAREDDLPGHLIPERYFAYLRSRRPELLGAIVEHNQQDIVSLARLLSVLADGVGSVDAWPDTHPGDLFGLARAYARRHRHEEALALVDAALGARAWQGGVEGGAALHRRLSAEQARLLGRLGRRDEAHRAWLAIAERGGPGAGMAWVHVARYREHVSRDINGALAACQQALGVAERARAWGEPLTSVETDLARRLPRLRRMAFRRRPLSPNVGRAA
jgi:uncharacterized protein YprB with RNaseH-like and TPR domain